MRNIPVDEIPVWVPESITIKGNTYNTNELLNQTKDFVYYTKHGNYFKAKETGRAFKRMIPQEPACKPAEVYAPPGNAERRYQVWWDLITLSSDDFLKVHTSLTHQQLSARKFQAMRSYRTNPQFSAWLHKTNLI